MGESAADQFVAPVRRKETHMTNASLILKAIVIVLAIIGLIALLGVAGMAVMHFSMMHGMHGM